MRRPQGAKITDGGEERSLRVVDSTDQFRHQEVNVGIALAVRVSRFVDGHVIDESREVRAVIQVEPANEKLVRLALAGMHCHDQARHGLQNLSDTVDRSEIQLLLRNRSLAGRGSFAEEIDPGLHHINIDRLIVGFSRIRGRCCWGVRNWRLVSRLRRWHVRRRDR